MCSSERLLCVAAEAVSVTEAGSVTVVAAAGAVIDDVGARRTKTVVW
jgi:hypothetical protein